MSVLHSPESAESQERVKWEAQRSQYGEPLRPYVYRDYPLMMHLAGPPAGGVGAITIIDTVVVGGTTEEDTHRQRGFRRTPDEAVKFYDDQQTEFMTLSAERAYDVKYKLGERAVAEVIKAENAHPGHLPSMPVTPIKPRRGRPAKVQAS